MKKEREEKERLAKNIRLSGSKKREKMKYKIKKQCRFAITLSK